ncbi:Hsp20/alpha crystallin family protein [Gracilimonas mengyeensis]|nr:Hsp20/alpha crystallin family protein [Gracilimonas mengyeensis]
MRTKTENFPTLWNDNQQPAPLKISNWIDEMFENAAGTSGLRNASFIPELNVYETDKEFEVSVALPGMNKNDFELSYESGLLTISGERKMERKENGRRYHRLESRFGKFSRSLPLPGDIIDRDKIKAHYENGVLQITVPKIKEKAARKITIS